MQLAIRIGDLSVNVGGIEGINDNIVDGFSVTVGDLTNIAESYEVALLADDPAALEAITDLTSLETGDILFLLLEPCTLLALY